MSPLDLSQARSLARGGDLVEMPQGPCCHRTMHLMPVPGPVVGTMTGALISHPCLREKCSLWAPEKERCADACLEGTPNAS